MEGQPRPRQSFRPDPQEVQSPALVDYPYGLVLDRGYLKVWMVPGISAAARRAVAVLLADEANRLLAEAEKAERRIGERSIATLVHRTGGDVDGATEGEPEPPASTALGA